MTRSSAQASVGRRRRGARRAPRFDRRRSRPRRSRPRRRKPRRQAALLPRRRRAGVAERHRHRRHRALRHRPRAGGLQVFEDGVKQDVTFFNRTNLPIALALLIDTSASMDAAADRAGGGGRLRPPAAAAGSGRDHRLRQPGHHSAAVHQRRDELEQAIRQTSAGGSTSMYNAIYIALKDLKKIVATNVEEIRRQAIVVLSDGEDTSSLLPFEEVLDLAKRSETAIYAIGFAPAMPSTGSKGFKEAEFVLRQLAQETGGRAFFPDQVTELAERLRPDLRRAVEPVHASATRRAISGATARGGGSSCA